MDTQNTPVHVRLWNRDFWLLAFANMLVTMAVYMQLVLLQAAPGVCHSMVRGSMAAMLASYAVGLYLFGCFCSYLVQRKRRNRVCIYAILLLAVCLVVPYDMRRWIEGSWLSWVTLLTRLLTGALFGIIQMILSSTLVVDCSESCQRTEANYAEAWFGRLAMALGPLTGLVVAQLTNHEWAVWVSSGLAVVSVLLIMMVRFPFRAPDDNVSLFSTDRFFLPSAWLLFINLLLVSMAVGVCLSFAVGSPLLFAALMTGFLIALLAEKLFFVNVELKSETVSALILIGLAAWLLAARHSSTSDCVAFSMVGLGSGLIGSRFLLFFIKLSHHCQRGTSQSTFFLSWESGIALGLALSYAFIETDGWPARQYVLSLAWCLVILSLLLYLLFTHQWYIRHKNR